MERAAAEVSSTGQKISRNGFHFLNYFEKKIGLMF
jgi:hypothetical protein